MVHTQDEDAWEAEPWDKGLLKDVERYAHNQFHKSKAGRSGINRDNEVRFLASVEGRVLPEGLDPGKYIHCCWE